MQISHQDCPNKPKMGSIWVQIGLNLGSIWGNIWLNCHNHIYYGRGGGQNCSLSHKLSFFGRKFNLSQILCMTIWITWKVQYRSNPQLSYEAWKKNCLSNLWHRIFPLGDDSRPRWDFLCQISKLETLGLICRKQLFCFGFLNYRKLLEILPKMTIFKFLLKRSTKTWI